MGRGGAAEDPSEVLLRLLWWRGWLRLGWGGACPRRRWLQIEVRLDLVTGGCGAVVAGGAAASGARIRARLPGIWCVVDWWSASSSAGCGRRCGALATAARREDGGAAAPLLAVGAGLP